MKKELHNLPVGQNLSSTYKYNPVLIRKNWTSFVNGFLNQNRSQKTDKQIALKQDSFTLVTSN